MSLLKQHNVTLIKGVAQIVDKNNILVNDKTRYHTKHLIIATGSRPKTVSGFDIDEQIVLSSTGILNMTELPNSLVIYPFPFKMWDFSLK